VRPSISPLPSNRAVVDTASSIGQAGDKGFFKNQAQIHIAAALETLREIGADVTLENAYHLLLDQGDLDEAMTDLASSHQTLRRRELADHFSNRFLLLYALRFDLLAAQTRRKYR
jgi:hypothetical protein